MIGNNVSWGRSLPRVIMELQTDTPQGWRYYLARFLMLIAARIINSKIITRRTLPVLEAE
jgi:hypothetical protein